MSVTVKYNGKTIVIGKSLDVMVPQATKIVQELQKLTAEGQAWHKQTLAVVTKLMSVADERLKEVQEHAKGAAERLKFLAMVNHSAVGAAKIYEEAPNPKDYGSAPLGKAHYEKELKVFEEKRKKVMEKFAKEEQRAMDIFKEINNSLTDIKDSAARHVVAVRKLAGMLNQ